jgi:hypothetical protein
MVNNHGSRKNKSLIIPDIGKITYDNFVSNTVAIRNKMGQIVENYMFIGEQLKFVKDNKIFKLGDYKSFIDYCKSEFNLGKNQAYNFINVYERFSDEKYKHYNFSLLVEMLSLPESKFKEVTPDTTVKEIREIKKKEKLNEKETKTVEIIEGQISYDEVIEAIETDFIQVEEIQPLFDDFQVKFLSWVLDSYCIPISLEWQSKFDKSTKLFKTFGKEKIDIATELGIIRDKLSSL